jgi:DNA-binding PadR family transcriptional regulator
MTNAELAILSLVAEQPQHGYQIEQTIEARGMRDWTEVGFSSIYYLLNKLEKAGLIESHLETVEGRGPARKVYQVTPQGRDAHAEVTLEALSEPKPCFTPFLLGVSNLPTIPRNQAVTALYQFRDALEKRRVHVIARAQEQHPLPDHVAAMFAYSQAMLIAELAWIEKFISQLEAQDVES